VEAQATAVAPTLAESPFGDHILGVGERDGVPVMLTAGPGTRQATVRRLEGPFALRFGGPRLCTGRWQDGLRVPCPDQAAVGAQPTCLPCSGLDHPECVFEPMCQNAPDACLCLRSFHGVEHLVYVAFHGVLPKVGMTQARRVEARLREQGADAYLVVARGLDRPGARQLERAIAFLHGIPEHRSHRETLPQLARPVPWDTIAQRAEALAARLGRDQPVEPVLHRVAGHAVAQPLPGRPRRVATHGVHKGTWLGAKGNHLFYAQAPGPGRLDAGTPAVAAVKRSDLIGHFVRDA